MTGRGELRFALVGHGFMGAAHSQALRVAPAFVDLPLAPVMATLVGRDVEATRAAASRWGWRSTASDWRDVVDDPDIDVVDVCSPGATHVEIAVAALEAGKHVLCEKPLANTVAEAERMAEAAASAAERGVFAMVGFSYRRVPAVTLARDVVRSGRIGEVRQVQAQYLQDWLVDADDPMTWRLDKSVAGSGALGDIGAHAIDAAQFVTGLDMTQVSGTLHTFVTERPLVDSSVVTSGLGGVAGSERGAVTVDDAAWFTARMGASGSGAVASGSGAAGSGASASGGGVIASVEASRFATGRKNAFRLEVSGSRGAVAFDLERPNELELLEVDGPESGFRRVLVTEPEHPYVGSWWPAGHGLGWEHAFTHQLSDLVVALAAGRQPTPSFADGLQVQRVLDAVERSSAGGSAWTAVA